jgi:hypothetical protein
MKTNIYQKLHKASCEAGGVVKGKKVPGMHFNPLQHDEVQKVAMETLLSNDLYPVCTYESEIKESFVMITCNMKIHDVSDPTAFIEINGCSAMGNLDKFGTGNGMSYAKKYAFLNALNLKTGLDNDDGYKTKPFEKPTHNIPKATAQTKAATNGKSHVYLDDKIDVEMIKDHLKNAQHIPRLNYLMNTAFKNEINHLLKNNLRAYRQVTDIAENRELILNNQSKID